MKKNKKNSQPNYVYQKQRQQAYEQLFIYILHIYRAISCLCECVCVRVYRQANTDGISCLCVCVCVRVFRQANTDGIRDV